MVNEGGCIYRSRLMSSYDESFQACVSAITRKVKIGRNSYCLNGFERRTLQLFKCRLLWNVWNERVE